MTPEKTLPDYLRPGLRLVLIGTNPGTYSAQMGHYYARPGNLFWWALSNSGLVKEPVSSLNDADLLEEGIGLTDVAKRPTPSSGDLRQDEFDAGIQGLVEKLKINQPQVACFVGLIGATAFLGRAVRPGPLSERIGDTRFYTIPSTSRRNAHYGRDEILRHFRELARFVQNSTPHVPFLLTKK